MVAVGFGGAGMGWTEERWRECARLYLEGNSASQIAKALGGITRNAVIGKLHRMGETRVAGPARPRPVVGAKAPAAPRTKQASMPRSVAQPAALPPATRSPRAVIIAFPSSTQCRWPIGDPDEADFTFCGDAAVNVDKGGPQPVQSPYCLAHHQLAYQPPKASRPANGQELARSLRRYL